MKKPRTMTRTDGALARVPKLRAAPLLNGRKNSDKSPMVILKATSLVGRKEAMVR